MRLPQPIKLTSASNLKLIFSLCCTLLFASSAFPQDRGLRLESSKSEQRVALVIGNGAYETAPLKNPVNDAQDMAQALKEIGFDVIYHENLNQNDMKRAIRAFGEKIKGGGVALFYYAGHGTQVNGANYLIPIGAKIEKETEVEYECVDAGFVLAQMDNAGNRMNIVILDACRNNPFARSYRSASNGLAQMNAPSGTLIAYSTSPNSTASDGSGRNGVYTQELLKSMRTPGLAIEEVFKRVRISVRDLTKDKQTPWESSSLVGDFYFSGTNKGTSAEAKATPGSQTTVSSTQSPPARQAEPILNISGVWRNATDPNSVYQITQDGNQFRLTRTGAAQGISFKSTGGGTITGQNLTLRYTVDYSNGYKQTGDCVGVVSPNGMSITWTCTDSALGSFVTTDLRQ